ncbi:MAG TPA: signal peptidase II [Zoogloea sp.]|uniref:signal peptidase II n=1 Tax=Zoogloea sp. TaxID=49181 RepID=UPI002B57520F|nr:signal peptidase II [Zoogloea sp.]HMV16649.1 signal peptidase II [Rhodocyclaceae bacterium]HMV63643.1 signal peptidase II [Rhodocyclaceae bacterium]HMW52189.1 signal peptidase II [Rhodocyclaceae bacterium]HMY49297.1 signal peptidase II [Rhodocyclaceae bacterium]HMZ74532.1 signal peptidase II [Rhodocyclaceae bacterium]
MKLRLGNWIGLAAVVVLLDQWTKHLVRGALRTGEVIPVTDFFDLVLAFNPGAAFSFLADQAGWQRWFFVALAAVICGWLLRLVARHQHEFLQPLAFSLIIGGAIGNVIDRFVFGAVVDFLYFHVGRYGWPAFNVADSAICVGVTLMVIAQLREHRHAPTRETLS